ncbi:MAG: hypothetical protein ABFC12_06600 [Methanobacterium sp.]
MGNQITFSPKKDRSVTGEDTLEIENIQLKATNRKLISKLDQQKQLIKKLNQELQIVKTSKESRDYNQLKKEYHTLKSKNDNLETLLLQSRKEIIRLKRELSKLTGNSGEPKSSPWDKLKNIRK